MSRNINLDYVMMDETGNSIIKDTKTAYSPEFIAAFGLEFSPVKQVFFNFTNKYVGVQYLSNEEPADGKLDAYFVSDVVVRYQPNISFMQNVELSVLINNIFDAEYESYGAYYGAPYYFPQAGINVLGGVKLRF